MSDTVLPVPCTNVEEETVKEWLAKVTEEVNEFAFEVLFAADCPEERRKDFSGVENADRILLEATDAITAITSMLDALGFDEDARQDAQRRVNELNKERGRI